MRYSRKRGERGKREGYKGNDGTGYRRQRDMIYCIMGKKVGDTADRDIREIELERYMTMMRKIEN